MPTQNNAGISKSKTKRKVKRRTSAENARRKLSSERVKHRLHLSGSKPKKVKGKEPERQRTETTELPPRTAAKDKNTRLTVDQMLAIYPFEQVKSAILNIDHEKVRANSVKLREDLIKAGSNVNACKEQLEWLDKFVPHRRPIDPDEADDLHPDTLWRIICLKFELRDQEELEYGKDNMKNANAVLASYRSKKLKFDRNKVTVWVDGKMVKNITLEDWAENEAKINKEMIKERTNNGGGLPWVENAPAKSLKKISTTFPRNISEHAHLFSVQARLIGTTTFVQIDNFLWDTGSEETEIFRDDKVALGLDLISYTGMLPNGNFQTGGGTITRGRFNIELQLLDTAGVPWGEWIVATCLYQPRDFGADGETFRASGSFLKSAYFSGIAPSNALYDGILALADTKSSLNTALPSKPKTTAPPPPPPLSP